MIDSFVNAVYLYDDKIVLTFNYKDGTKTISLDDVNSSDLDGFGPPGKPLEPQGFGGFLMPFPERFAPHAEEEIYAGGAGEACPVW